jgi:hypothetical protein
MADKDDQNTKSQEKNQAADMRPIPSQAEGDLETVEEDLEQKRKSDDTSGQKH